MTENQDQHLEAEQLVRVLHLFGFGDGPGKCDSCIVIELLSADPEYHVADFEDAVGR